MVEAKLSRLELLRKRKQEIEQQMKALEAREREEERKKDTRRKIIVGAAVLAHASIDADFARTLRAILKKAVTEERNLALIDDLLNGAKVEAEPAKPDGGETP